jgi:hypothetical protein
VTSGDVTSGHAQWSDPPHNPLQMLTELSPYTTNMVERDKSIPNIPIHDRYLCHLGTGISIKKWWVKLFLCAQTFPLSEMIAIQVFFTRKIFTFLLVHRISFVF